MRNSIADLQGAWFAAQGRADSNKQEQFTVREMAGAYLGHYAEDPEAALRAVLLDARTHKTAGELGAYERLRRVAGLVSNAVGMWRKEQGNKKMPHERFGQPEAIFHTRPYGREVKYIARTSPDEVNEHLRNKDLVVTVMNSDTPGITLGDGTVLGFTTEWIENMWHEAQWAKRNLDSYGMVTNA